MPHIDGQLPDGRTVSEVASEFLDPTTWPLELCKSCLSMTRTTPAETCGKCGHVKTGAASKQEGPADG